MSNAGALEIMSFRSRSSSSEVQALNYFFSTQLSDKPYFGKIITHAMTVIASSAAPNQSHCARSAASLLASWRNFLNFSRLKRSSFGIPNFSQRLICLSAFPARAYPRLRSTRQALAMPDRTTRSKTTINVIWSQTKPPISLKTNSIRGPQGDGMLSPMTSMPRCIAR